MQGRRGSASGPGLAALAAVAAAAVIGLSAATGAASGAAPNYHYEVPVQASSPWPEMRRDRRNTGASPIRSIYHGDRPWGFRTGRGIFSTPIVGGDGDVYVGSADSWFYAIRPNGRLSWKLRTGYEIDSAGVIGAFDKQLGTSPITFGSADENLYHVRPDRRRLSRSGRIIWAYHAPKISTGGQIVDWWEGNAEIGFGGTIYAGNTDGAAYAFNPNGTFRWRFVAGNSVWTVPAFARDGTSFWGSLDRNVYALDSNGKQVWSFPTLGFIISSPALGNDGTLYIGSFDSRMYALDSRTGAPKWYFATADHVYSSPALAEDAHGNTQAIYIASTDGYVYAVNPAGGLIWKYFIGDPIRSSPVLGAPPPGGAHRILYVGAGNGTLYALDAVTGQRRWSYDTTSRNPVLHDRNDLNASPALGTRGVYIGSEDGHLYYVPYDYCLHRTDSRCNVHPGEDFPANATRVYPVTAGGNTALAGLQGSVGRTAITVGRLLVRSSGQTEDAAMLGVPSPQSLVSASPPFPMTVELSGDGHYVFVRPTGFLQPSTNYRVRIGGLYKSGCIHVVTGCVGGTGGGPFSDTIAFRTGPAGGKLPLSVGRRRVSALHLRRLAIPEPSFIPSVNQIGFDSYDFLVGTLAKSPPGPDGEGRALLWVAGAKAKGNGRSVVDPSRSFAFPLSARYRGNQLIMSAQNVDLTFSFGSVPVQLVEFRGQLRRGGRMLPGNFLYAEVMCANVPYYGPQLVAVGLCNQSGKLVATGTYVTSGYTRRGSANRRPRRVSLRSLALARPTSTQNGSANATLKLAHRARYPISRHVASILLTDAATGDVVSLDYKADTTESHDRHGNLVGVHLQIPSGTSLPARVRAYVVTDVFPLASRVL
ncbi:MAG: PQQ-like beta-propeller repeat protein [Actinobacteria bacterium]|nr:PQQ-like beta-propeller repeat protein [Actinomycetota bacterium]